MNGNMPVSHRIEGICIPPLLTAALMWPLSPGSRGELTKTKEYDPLLPRKKAKVLHYCMVVMVRRAAIPTGKQPRKLFKVGTDTDL